MTKIEKLQQWMIKQRVDITFLTDPKSIAYLTGYANDPYERVLAYIILAKGVSFFVMPALDAEDAKNSVDLPIHGYYDHEDPFALIQLLIEQETTDTQSFAIEQDVLSVKRLKALQQHFMRSTFDHDATLFLQQLMLIKTPDEIEKMKVAGKWADFALNVGRQLLKQGISEVEVIAEIEYALKKKGINQMSFETLVLMGNHAASPHGVPSTRTLQDNELVLFDLGVVCDGYTSDVTRMVAFGDIREQHQHIYDVVLAAQLAAQKAVKPGVFASELDKIARDVITAAGYGEYFVHRLGHGIGTTVHEYPSIMEGSDVVLEVGMCFSLEPGIYIPDTIGVRIEDCVYVTESGCEAFTTTSKTLLGV